MMGKRKRESTAAYAASQPLYAALKTGCDKVEDQANNLTAARDLVQNLHVKLEHIKIDDRTHQRDIDQHEQYVDSILAAWQTATETYSNIFQELVSVTAAQPAEGREASDAYDGFARMLLSATHASDEIKQVIVERTKHKPARSVNDTTSSKSVRKFGGKALGSKAEETQPPKKLSKHNAQDYKGTKCIKDDCSPSNAAMSSVHEKATERRNKSMEQKNVLDTSEPVDTTSQARQKVAGVAPNTFVKDGIRYENVSAEVAARLKAKEDSIRAAKAEESKKKRKRLVSDANAVVVAAGLGQDESKQPYRKKAKKALSIHDDTAGGQRITAAKEDVTQDAGTDKAQAKLKRLTDGDESTKKRVKGSPARIIIA